MAKLTRVSVVFLGLAGGAVALASVMSAGCGGSSSTPSGDDGGGDAPSTVLADGTVGQDGTVVQEAATGTEGAVTTQDAAGDAVSTGSDAAGDAAPGDAMPSCITTLLAVAPSAGGGTEAGADAAADAGAEAAADGAVDAAADAAAEASTDAATTDSAAEAAAADASAEATVDAAPTGPVLVSGFDMSTDTTGWSPQVDTALVDGGLASAAVSYSATVGRTCPGSVLLTVPFTSFSPSVLVDAGPDASAVNNSVMQQVELMYNYSSNAGTYPAWTNYTKLHYWVKVAFGDGNGGVLPDDASAAALDFGALSYDNNYAQWGVNYKSSTFDNDASTRFFNGTAFSGGDWQEVVLVLNDPSMFTADGGFPNPSGTSCQDGGAACKVASQVTIENMPSGGPATPPTTLLYLDDVWLE